MADAEDFNKSLVRTSTVAKINQFMQDHMIGEHDDLDIVTFIFAAQAIKPGAQQEELMSIFAEAEDDESTDTATKMHKLLKRVSVVDASVGLASSPLGSNLVEGLITEDFGAAPVFAHPAARGSVDSEADDGMPAGRGRRKSLMEQAEIDATESMARTAEKLDIAAEMIHLGHSAETVASVTGLELGSINAIVNAAKFSPRKARQLSQEQISDLIRLCSNGPETVAAEAELAHTLLVAMKDQVLSMAGANKEVMTFESTMTNEPSNTEESMAVQESAEPGESAGELPKSLGPGMQSGEGTQSLTYVLDFTQKPLGMSWNQTSDGKNLYVQDVLEGGLAQRLGVLVGSVIDSFNGDCVFGQGPEKIYQTFKSCTLPIQIGFRTPVASSATDPNVIMLKEVTGLETETVIKLLHKFGGNVQAANEAFYIAKARTRQWISKQKVQKDDAAPSEAEPKEKGGKTKKGRKWWKKWTKNVKKDSTKK